MKIAVLGSGAMGCLYGGSLAEAGFDVTLIDVWKEHVDAINSNGLHIEGVTGDRVIKDISAVTDFSSLGTVDLLVVFVKATITEEAMEEARGLVGDKTVVLTLQNGLGNIEKIGAVVGKDKVMAGTTGHGSTMLGPGHIRHAGSGDTTLGELDGSKTERLEKVAEMFRKAGFSIILSSNVVGLIWDKLLVNIGINPLTALTGLRNGQLLDFAETEELLESLVSEAREVAKRQGIQLSCDPVEHTKDVCRRTKENMSSMFQDVTKKRKTEIDVINGAIVEEGKKLGVETPVNRVITKLIKVREKTY
ncbi:MAG: ketopantoate reductase family protein [Thermovirgaceae bacterium]